MSRAKATADKLLAKLGTPITVTTTDPATGAAAVYAGHGAIVGTVRHQLPGVAVVDIGDDEIYVMADTLPEQGARIAYAGKDRVIAYAEAIYQAAVVAVWRVYAREG